MAIPIIIPRFGWNMEEGVFVGWLKPDGATIRAGEPLFSLESDKATEDVECLDAGILCIAPDGPQPGTKLLVGTVIGYLVAVGEAAPFESGTAQPARERGIDLAAVNRSGPGGRITAEDLTTPAPPNAAASLPPSERRAISPRARRVARALGIDWMDVRGSGRNGRIRERDIRAAAEKSSAKPEGNTVPVRSIRRTIAERMLASHQSTAPVTLTTTADAVNLVNLRNQFKAAGSDGVPSYTDFLVKLTAIALAKHLLLNSRWEDEQVVTSPDIHIGIAVDTDAGLLVPVVRDVPVLGLRQLSARTRDLATRARAGKLAADELRGGTFTLTNLGALGIDAFTPIINSPQCAILGIGRIERRPAVVGEQIVARDQLTLSLTFDHRIVDGAPAARFLQTLRTLIENPGPALMS
ncbi:MAG TPA: dihydrolipoamide acetyltransferase family protein [Gemmataceae bacterium]|jgi:pyruvate dehydrogenase E2 component (dihydrolipoamide acetyltransferase)